MDNFALVSRKSKQSRDEGGHQRVGPEQQADDPSSGAGDRRELAGDDGENEKHAGEQIHESLVNDEHVDLLAS